MRTSTNRVKASGKLRHSIELQHHTEYDRQADGGIVPQWTTWMRTWASVSPLSGLQLERAMQIAGKVTHEVTMRHVAGVTRQMRIKHNDRYLTISAVLNTGEQNIEMKLLCSEAV